jgi:mannitol-1-/sugar-/sorbitol-6-phosphatase
VAEHPRVGHPLGALLLDMDGTLVDSGEVVERHWRRFAGRHGLDAETFLGRVHGVRSSDVIAAIAPWLDAEAEAALLDAAEEADHDGLRPVRGAAELLETLPADRWAVVTSAHRSLAANRLTAVGLPVPAVMVCGDETTAGKPDPQGYLAAAARLRVPAADCLVVEDAPAGVEAGRRAGMLVVGITTNHVTSELAAADAHIADLVGLPDAVAALGRRLPA